MAKVYFIATLMILQGFFFLYGKWNFLVFLWFNFENPLVRIFALRLGDGGGGVTSTELNRYEHETFSEE